MIHGYVNPTAINIHQRTVQCFADDGLALVIFVTLPAEDAFHFPILRVFIRYSQNTRPLAKYERQIKGYKITREKINRTIHNNCGKSVNPQRHEQKTKSA